MQAYHFVLLIKGPVEREELERCAVEADRTDGLVGNYPDEPFIELEREGESLLEVVTAAMRDVHKTGLRVDRLEHESPELVKLDSVYQAVKNVPDAVERLQMIEQLAIV